MPLMPKLDCLSNVLLTMFDLLLDTLSFIRVSLRPRAGPFPRSSRGPQPPQQHPKVPRYPGAGIIDFRCDGGKRPIKSPPSVIQNANPGLNRDSKFCAGDQLRQGT